MSIPTHEGQGPPTAGGKGRPVAWLIAAILGLGGLGVATGMALGAVGDTSPKPASTDHGCPGRGGYGGPGFGSGSE